MAQPTSEQALAGSPFRSEAMSLIQLYMPSEVAQATIAELGELDVLQFRDLNSEANAFQRTFVNDIRRLDEMERQLRFLSVQTIKSGLTLRPFGGSAPIAYTRSIKEIDELEARLAELEDRIKQMNSSQEALSRRHLELTELRHVLTETAVFFSEVEARQEDGRRMPLGGDTEETGSPLLVEQFDVEANETSASRAMNLGFVAGVLLRRKMPSFERVLWRALRGNLYMNYAEIDEPITDPSTNEFVEKNVFIIFAHGRETLSKIRKISESLGATLYPIDEHSDKRRENNLEVIARIEDVNNILYNTNQTRKAELSKVAENLEGWMRLVRQEKAIYHTLNLCNYDGQRKTLIAEAWCPSKEINQVAYALRSASERSGASVSTILNEVRTHLKPPTFHRTNKVTSAFQAIIDAYGMATYQEVNPGLFTVISFPFLFAIMFGDLGHGVLMTLFAAFLVLNEVSLNKSMKGELQRMIYGARYMLLLMGLFSIYIGLLYNDVFSRSLPLFPSGFTKVVVSADSFTAVPVDGYSYPFGVDYIWHGVDNQLLFSNSYKMKQAIILGVIHMLFGIFLSFFNHTFFQRPLNILCDFIPQVLMLSSIFGYLCVLMIFKWLIQDDDVAPSLLNVLINMFLKVGDSQRPNLFYSGQFLIETVLVLVFVLCIPWMWFLKPFYLRYQHEKRLKQGYAVVRRNRPGQGLEPQTPNETGALLEAGNATGGGAMIDAAHAPHNASSEQISPTEAGGGGGDGHGDGEFNFSDVFVHQTIHTIEFALGTISNTASYLRLWALSLAHAQLSDVLWFMILDNTRMSPVLLYIGFFMWFSLTIFILLGMEGLSAFLHALRLHWVEFDGKFYEGAGYKFEPFSFKSLDKDEDESE